MINLCKARAISFIAVGILLVPTFSFGQLGLEECYKRSEENYPVIQQYDLIETSRNFQLENISRGYLPQLAFTARATYQSEVIGFPSYMAAGMGAAFPILPKDQYQIATELSQVIWDGGNMRAQKRDIEAQSEVSKRKTDIDIYALRERVNGIYFGILLIDAQLKQSEIYLDELDRDRERVSGYITNGIAYKSDIDLVDVEILNTKQRQNSLNYSREAYVMMLSVMIGSQLDSNVKLVILPMISVENSDIKRAELDLFDAQVAQAQTIRNSINARNMPHINAFFNGAYSQPGMNMFKPDFSPNYIAGVSLSWNFGNLYTRKNELKLIDINVRSIGVQRETFLYNVNIQLAQQHKEISSLEQQVDDDVEIVKLRNRIVETAEAKVVNGVMDVYGLMKETTLLHVAEQTKVINQTRLLKAVYDLKFITNND